MTNILDIREVELIKDCGITVTFSDGTVAHFPPEELAALRPYRESLPNREHSTQTLHQIIAARRQAGQIRAIRSLGQWFHGKEWTDDRESLLWESARLRQRQAPLLNEREQYLGHMLNVGMKAKRVRATASVLLHVVRLMNLDSLRAIETAEIIEASERWTTDTKRMFLSRCHGGRSSRLDSPRCCRSSTSSLTRAIPPPRARIGSGQHSAKKLCDWDTFWPDWSPKNQRSTDWLR